MESVDWTPILWLGGITGGAITILLTVIGFLLQRIGGRIEIRLDVQDGRLSKHDEEIHELALSSRETLTIIKHKLKIK